MSALKRKLSPNAGGPKQKQPPALKSRDADWQWLLSLIRLIRPDLCQLFKTSDAVSLDFARWLITSGIREYGALRVNNKFKNILNQPCKIFGLTALEGLIYLEREDVRKAFRLPDQKLKFRQWFYQYAVDQHGLLDLLNEDGRKVYQLLHPEKPLPSMEPVHKTDTDAPFGVNLVGYAFGQLGIGEDLRMTAYALKSADVPFTIINFPPGQDIPQNDKSVAEYVGDAPIYNINIFCMTAEETARFYAEKGPDFFEGKYNIGYWPWELSQWPEPWHALTDLVDEVWVSSRHIYDALAPVSSVPVLIMPLAVDTSELSTLKRKDFHLPDDSYLFCFSFDLNSSIHRKNPQACLKAFQQAFPMDDKAAGQSVGLVIKCHKPAKENKHWDELKDAARRDSRIHIIEETLSRPDLLALYKCCDCYISLHRAEGFGRGIAEALQMELDVIATGYSGNLDYCANTSASLVPFRLVPVRNGEYPHNTGQVWAEPDVEAAAGMLRQKALNKKSGSQAAIMDLSVARAGTRFKARLGLVQEQLNRRNLPDGESLPDVTAPLSFDDAQGLSRGAIDYAICWPDPLLNKPLIISGWLVAPDGFRLLCGDPEGKHLKVPQIHFFNRPDIVAAHDLFINKGRFGNGFVLELEWTGESDRQIAIFLEKDGHIFKLCQHAITDYYNFRLFLKSLFEINFHSSDLAAIYKAIYMPLLTKIAAIRARDINSVPIIQGTLGKIPQNPKTSIIIPLFGTIADMKNQLAGFASVTDFAHTAELIYILDDPSILDAFRMELETLYKTLQVPARWATFNGSQGFSGACNLGARLANSDILIFMNSDVIPLGQDWLQLFTRYLAANPDTGVAGCRLLYPDGSIQHGGCILDWQPGTNIFICRHRLEGEKEEMDSPAPDTEISAVTGACLAIRHKDFDQAGGFGSEYLIGSYEDLDLCLKIKSAGKNIAYLPQIRMIHYCHKSFAHLSDGEWKERLAIYNAVVFKNKWHDYLEAEKIAAFGMPLQYVETIRQNSLPYAVNRS